MKYIQKPQSMHIPKITTIILSFENIQREPSLSQDSNSDSEEEEEEVSSSSEYIPQFHKNLPIIFADTVNITLNKCPPLLLTQFLSNIANLPNLRNLVIQNSNLHLHPPNVTNVSNTIKPNLTVHYESNDNRLMIVPGVSPYLHPFLTTFNLSHNCINLISPAFSKLASLKKLNLSYNKLMTVSKSIFELPVLEDLNLSFNPLFAFSPHCIMNSLEKLNLTKTALFGIDGSIGNCPKLKQLILDSCTNLDSISQRICLCKNLSYLSIEHSRIGTIPYIFDTHLRYFSLATETVTLDCQRMPKFERLLSIEKLSIKLKKHPFDEQNIWPSHLRDQAFKIPEMHNIPFEQLPLGIRGVIPESNINTFDTICGSIYYLYLENYPIYHLYRSTPLKLLREIYLPNCGVASLEEEQDINLFPMLSKIDLSGNTLSAIPTFLKYCKDLKFANFEFNNIDEIPAFFSLQIWPHLHTFLLKKNPIDNISTLIFTFAPNDSKLTHTDTILTPLPRTEIIELNSPAKTDPHPTHVSKLKHFSLSLIEKCQPQEIPGEKNKDFSFRSGAVLKSVHTLMKIHKSNAIFTRLQFN